MHTGTSEVVWEVFDAILNCSMHNYEKLSTENKAKNYLHLAAEVKNLICAQYGGLIMIS